MKRKVITTLILSISMLTTTFAQRKVLIEQFTNSGCPPCAANTPVVAIYVNANSTNVIMLSYHTSFPYLDSMYYENSVPSDRRVTYYGISGVPNSRVDGNYFAGNLVPTISTTIPQREAISPRYSISFNSTYLSDSTVSINITFQSIDVRNQNETLTAMVVLAEKTVLKSAYVCCVGANSETEYPWVVRKMLPDENGTTLLNKQLNGTDNLSLTTNATNFKDLTEMRVIAFVQNIITKEVYQTEIFSPGNTTTVHEIKSKESKLFYLYPTIAQDYFTIQLNKIQENSKVRILNVIGETVYAALATSTITVQTANFPNGIYFVQIGNEALSETQKIIVKK